MRIGKIYAHALIRMKPHRNQADLEICAYAEKWPLYCPQGSGTLRQQLLMMHGIAMYCIVLHSIAWYCMVLHGIAW